MAAGRRHRVNVRLDAGCDARTCDLFDPARLRLGHQLAAALADRLAAVVPDGITVSASNDGVCVESQHGWGTTIGVIAVLDQPGDLNDLVQTVAWNVLSTVQDFVSEAMKDMWPFNPMPYPHAALVDDELRLWYGNEKRLELPSVFIGLLQ